MFLRKVQYVYFTLQYAARNVGLDRLFKKKMCVDMKGMGECISLPDVDSNVGVCLIKGGIPIYAFSIGTSYEL